MDENQSNPNKETILHHPKAMKAMSKISKMTLLLCSFFLFIVLLMAIYKNLPKPAEPETKALRPVITAKPTMKPEPSIASLPITLEGPLTCEYSSNEATVSASIINRKLFLSIDEASASSRFLVRDNCSYSWSPLTNTGEKNCNMEDLLQTADLMASVGFLNMNQVIKIIPTKTEHKLYKSPVMINKVIATCQKVASNEAFFIIPSNVVFTETSAQPQL